MSGQRDQNKQAGEHGQRHHPGQHGLPGVLCPGRRHHGNRHVLGGDQRRRRFYDVLRQVCAEKPVLVWKVGETEDAARAVASHSTSMTTESAIWDAMLRQCGAIKTESVDEVFEDGQASPATAADHRRQTGADGVVRRACH